MKKLTVTLLFVGSSRSFCLIGLYWFFEDEFELDWDVVVDLGWCWAIWGNGVLLYIVKKLNSNFKIKQ